MVMLIVYLTESPMYPLVTLTVLFIFRSATGSAVMFVLFDVTVSLSVELTVATFMNVPFVITLHTTHRRATDPLLKSTIVQTTLFLPSTKVVFVPVTPVILLSELMYFNPTGNMSVTLTPLASE